MAKLTDAEACGIPVRAWASGPKAAARLLKRQSAKDTDPDGASSPDDTGSSAAARTPVRRPDATQVGEDSRARPAPTTIWEPLAVPTLHLNGSAASVLVGQLRDAQGAVCEALGRLQAAAPNHRDYYVREGEWPRAQAQHRARLVRLELTRDELTALLESVVEQDDARSRRRSAP